MRALPQLRAADYNEGHPSTLPIAADLELPEASVFRDPEFAIAGPPLSTEEAEHFKREGFLVKRRLLSTRDAFDEIRAHIWRHVPSGLMSESAPHTWIAPDETQWTEDDALRVGALSLNSWKMRSKGRSGIGTEQFLVDEIANHPNMLAMARQLMGGEPQRVRRVRGIYCVFPAAPGSKGRYGPHTDNVAAHLSAMVIADSVPPRCGGFTLWPRSHLRLHRFWRTVHGGEMDGVQAQAFLAAREQVLVDTRPIEFAGEAGDVMFWHPRCLHSAGINHSAELGRPLLRIVVPCDYQLTGRDYFDDKEFGPGEDYMWWIDTRNFKEDVPPKAENMWADWGPLIQNPHR